MSSSIDLPDLVIQKCIPDCTTCPRVWTNPKLNHKIICNCIKCVHNVINQNTTSNISLVKNDRIAK